MELIRLYWSPVIILATSFLITFFLPEDKRIQIFAPLVVGILMFSIRSLLGLPDVVIEDLGKEATYSLIGGFVKLSIKGRLKNKSATGTGDIESLILRIISKSGETINARPERGMPSTGYRLNTHGNSGYECLYFEANPVQGIKDIAGQPAKILLKVNGQSLKIYKIVIANKLS
jgi:hypothetical protein